MCNKILLNNSSIFPEIIFIISFNKLCDFFKSFARFYFSCYLSSYIGFVAVISGFYFVKLTNKDQYIEYKKYFHSNNSYYLLI